MAVHVQLRCCSTVASFEGAVHPTSYIPVHQARALQ